MCQLILARLVIVSLLSTYELRKLFYNEWANQLDHLKLQIIAPSIKVNEITRTTYSQHESGLNQFQLL